MWRGLALALGLAAPMPAAAHPHVFIDGGIDFVLDAEGRLAALRITWIYDPLTSLFMLEEIGIDPSGPLRPEDRQALASWQTEWVEGFEGDSYLWRGQERIGLSGPRAAEADLGGGRVTIRFLRDLDTPFHPQRDVVAKAYDPEYFTAYTITAPPLIEGPAEGCAATLTPFEPEGPLAALQRNLLDLGAGETPEDPQVGALFADTLRLTCA